MLLFEKEVAYCFATIVPSIYRPTVAFGSSAYTNYGCPKRANYEDQFSVSKLMIGIDSQVKDHGQLASLCTHPSLPIF